MSTSAMLIFRGRLGNDPQLRYTQSGKAVVNFNLAIDQGFGDNKTTAWVRVSVWEKQAEAANEWLSKGDLIEVKSEMFRVNAWNAQDGSAQGQLEVTARSLDYIITKHANATTSPDNEEVSPDEIPF